LITGVFVSHSGRPLSVGLITVHKLIALGTLVLIGMTVFQLYKTTDEMVIVEMGVIMITGILFLSLIAAGAMLTREEMQLPELVLKIHQVVPLQALASFAITFPLLVRGRS
jgi:hypothetical protein